MGFPFKRTLAVAVVICFLGTSFPDPLDYFLTDEALDSVPQSIESVVEALSVSDAQAQDQYEDEYGVKKVKKKKTKKKIQLNF